MATVRAMNGVEIAYERVGQGPPLVFVHGAGLDGRMWQPQLAGPADEFTVVAWDEPGTGRPSDVPSGFGLADYARCLAAVIDDLRLGPVHVAGLSWGGTVVLELFRLRPELVRTLVLADTYAGWKGSLPPEEVRARVDGLGTQLLVMAEADQMTCCPRSRFPPCSSGASSTRGRLRTSPTPSRRRFRTPRSSCSLARAMSATSRSRSSSTGPSASSGAHTPDPTPQEGSDQMSMGTVLTLRPAGSRMRPMRLTKRMETAWSSTFS